VISNSGIVLALLLPEVHAASEAGIRTLSMNNLRQLGRSAHDFADGFTCFA
jgi:hypothetical protein